MPGGSSAAVREAGVVAAYTALTLLLTYPLARHVAEAVPGSTGDNWQNYWNLWWVRRALLERRSPWVTDLVFYPEGATLYLHTLNLLQNLIALPIAAVGGLTVAYNAIALFGFVGGGYAAYRLALDALTREVPGASRFARAAAFVAGASFTFSAYHFMHLRGHLNLVSLQWLPAGVLFVIRTWREDGSRNPLLAALFLVLTTLTDWYYTLYLLVFTVLFGVHHALAERGREDVRRRVRRLGLAVAAWAACVSPLLLATASRARTDGRSADAEEQISRLSADLLAFVVPSPSHSLWGSSLVALWDRMAPNQTETVVFFGYVALLLGFVGVARARPPRATFWTVAFVLFTVLALGPELRIAGKEVALSGHAIPLPYAFLRQLPGGDVPRAPARFAVMSSLCLAVLSAHGARWALARSRVPRALFATLLGLVLLENATVPLELSRVAVPPVYAKIAEDPRRMAVLEVPIADYPAFFPGRMLYQTRHGKPSYGGYLSRGLPPLPSALLPGFREFRSLDLDLEDIISYPGESLPAVALTVLAARDAGYVVVDRTVLDPGEVERARRVARRLFGEAPPAYEDAASLAFAVPPAPDAPAFVHLDRGWSFLETARRPPPERWRWMGERARLGMFVPHDGVWRLRMSGWAIERLRRLDVSLDGRASGRLEVEPRFGTTWSTPLHANRGLHVLDLVSRDGAVSEPGGNRLLSVAASEIALQEVPALAPGSPLALGERAADPYLGPGWSQAEGSFRWTDGGTAVVFLPLPGAETSVLHLRMRPHLPPGKGAQRLGIEWNGERVGSWVVQGAHVRTLRQAVPASRVVALNEVRLALPDAEAPTRLGVSEDERSLGVAVEALWLAAAPLWPRTGRLHLGNDAAQEYLGPGWSYPEGAFQWIEGPEAQVVFALQDRAARELRMMLNPHLAPGRLDHQRLEITLNGRPLAELQLNTPGPREYSVAVAAERLEPSNILAFRVPDARSPRALGLGGDTRALAVSVAWLDLRTLGAR